MVARNQKNRDPGTGDLIQRSQCSFNNGWAYSVVMKKIPPVNNQVYFLPLSELYYLQIILKYILSSPSPLNPRLAG
jgi:hypothetical protein